MLPLNGIPVFGVPAFVALTCLAIYGCFACWRARRKQEMSKASALATTAFICILYFSYLTIRGTITGSIH